MVLVFLAWDLYAVPAGHWEFDPAQTLGVTLPGGVPLEEVLFFLVVPTCALLALEAVRRVRGWPVGRRVTYTALAIVGVRGASRSTSGCCGRGC